MFAKLSRDMSHGQNNMLRQGGTSSFIIRKKFSLVKQIVTRDIAAQP